MNTGNDTTPNERITVFISHPTKYKGMAEVLRKTIIEWTGGRIQPCTTSDYGAATRHAPVTTGDTIRVELENILRKSCVIILLYVDAKTANWCMYEAGFAKAGGVQPQDTRVIVFQCAGEIPPVFESDLRIMLTEDGIRQFTRDFHRSDAFFPSIHKEYAPDLPDDFIEKRGKSLHLLLTKEWQLVEPDLEKPQIVSPRWILFTVSLEDTYVNQLYQLLVGCDNLAEALVEAKNTIEQHCIVERCDSNLPKHFGLARITADRKFYTFYHRWKDRLERDKREQFLNMDWWSETCTQIALTIRADDADAIRTPFKSAAEIQTWYLLVVTQQRTMPGEKKTEFDCTLIRIPEESDYIKITDPHRTQLPKKKESL